MKKFLKEISEYKIVWFLLGIICASIFVRFVILPNLWVDNAISIADVRVVMYEGRYRVITTDGFVVEPLEDLRNEKTEVIHANSNLDFLSYKNANNDTIRFDLTDDFTTSEYVFEFVVSKNRSTMGLLDLRCKDVASDLRDSLLNEIRAREGL